MWLALGSQVRELRNGELVVGSGAEADWRIADADLRPRHFVLTIYDLNASLKPASNAEVVVVNGAQVTRELPRLLNDGDVVLAGSARFLFSESEARDDEAPPADAEPGCLIDERTGVVHPLSRRSTGIGRDGSNVIVVPHPTVSRFHAEVRREAGGYALHAMGAAGTQVNGRPVVGAVLLGEGDVIAIGLSAWRVSTRLAGGSRPLPPSDPDLTRSAKPTELRARVIAPARARGAPTALLVVAVLLLAVAAAVYLIRG